MTTRKLVPLLAALLVLAACSAPAASPSTTQADGDTPEMASASPATANPGESQGGTGMGFDLCDAISADEVSEVAGTEVTDVTPADLGGVLSCNYLADDAAVAGTTLATSDSGVNPVDLFNANRDAEGNEDVQDLGDDAVLTGDEDFPILMVLVNGNLYSISVLADGLDGAGKREATIALARLSVDRLP